MNAKDEKPAWMERKANVDRIYRALWVICAVLALSDFFYHKHVVFRLEEMPAIYGIYGFVCFFGIVLAGKYLRKLVGRKEDYYEH